MAYVKNPLFSLSASGTLAGVITAFSHTGRSYIISKQKRRGLSVQQFSGLGRLYLGSIYLGFQGKTVLSTKSQTQNARRYVFSQALKSWNILSFLDKHLFELEAKFLQMTGQNLFISRFISSVF